MFSFTSAMFVCVSVCVFLCVVKKRLYAGGQGQEVNNMSMLEGYLWWSTGFSLKRIKKN